MKENNTYHDHNEDNNLPESLRVNPFAVPKDYFENLESGLCSQIRLLNTAPSEEESFSTPENYFNDLHSRLMTAVKMDQLKTNTEENGFTVPSNYFDQLQQQITANITADRWKDQIKEEGFAVPEDYFNTLEDSIFAGIATDRLKAEVKEDGYTVPSNYFDQLSADIQAKAFEKEQPKIVPIGGLKRRNWMRYAAAASVTLILGLGAYFGIQQEETATTDLHSELANVSDAEIINYLAATNSGDNMVYFTQYIYEPEESAGVGSQIDNEDIEEYLKYSL
ncbi:hypothetical protein [Sphingobacterium spiritivorum]|uniref:hypothetical protein n=1 Tax=Sphingobacterium spiritivorum TaxID=258 RepID=UPI00191A8478|nr:hypothetical protein [Sphingobacterium spiritivorum]QQT26737.1 hypothetical protein I6J02_02430 [Sphingobacterium spiritivorum]